MSNRDRAVEIMRSFWNDGRYAVGFDEIAKALADAGVLAPEPAPPRTMDKIEWDDEKHYLTEAVSEWFEGGPTKVVMLSKVDGKIMIHQDDKHFSGLRHVNPGILTPTGRKYRLEPEDDTPTPPIEDKPTPEQQALARDIFGSLPPEERHVHWAKPAPESASLRPEDVPVGEPWQVELDGKAAVGYRNDPDDMICWTVVYRDNTEPDWMYDEDVTLISRLVPEDAEQNDDPEFDPAHLYRDKDGETWEYLDGKWVQGDSRTDRLVSLNVNHGLNNLLPKYGPYTRIEK